MVVGIIEVGDCWPEAISDGLILPCGMCGKVPSFDYLVADTAWKTIVPEGMRLGVVCLPCFDRLAVEQGMHTSDVLRHVHFTGVSETIVLNPIEAYRFGGNR